MKAFIRLCFAVAVTFVFFVALKINTKSLSFVGFVESIQVNKLQDQYQNQFQTLRPFTQTHTDMETGLTTQLRPHQTFPCRWHERLEASE